MNEKWLEDKAVKNWFESIGLHKTRTLQNYKREFPIFLNWLREKYPEFKTPSDIIENRNETLKSVHKRHFWESVIIKYKNYLETRKTPKGTRIKMATIHGYLRSVQSFFSHNDVRLLFRRGELKVQPSEEEKIKRKWVLTNPEVRHLYRCAKTPRDRALILMLYQSGFSPIDVANMKIEDFPFYQNGEWNLRPQEHLYHCRRREKTNIWQETCVSFECLEDVRMMLEQRGFPHQGSLFVSFRGKPLDVREIHLAMKETVKRAFTQKAKEWKTKNLRDSYKNGLVQAKIPQEAIDCMFGHQRKGARKSYELTEPTTRMMYGEAFTFFRINGFSSTTRIDQLEKEFKEGMGTLSETLTKEIQKLTEQLELQKQETEHYVEKLVMEYLKKAKQKQ